MNSKEACLSIIIATLIALAQPACYNYWTGDTLPVKNSSSYCRKTSLSAVSRILWPVSDLVLNTSVDRDSVAMAYYQDLYNNSYLKGAVTEECLGMIQYMACAKAYPTCSYGTDQIQTVCSWLCTLMEIRCGTDSMLYRDACVTGTVADTSCSSGEALLWGLGWLLAFLLMQ